MLTYSLSDIGSASIYEYLYQCIRRDILQKKLKAGEKLPSKRSFARNMQVSVVTVENAYAQLMVEGYIYAIEKRGYFVADIDQTVAAPHAASEMRVPEPEKKETENKNWLADFVSNTISYEKFPFSVWSKLVREVILSEDSMHILSPAPSGGVYKLRAAIARHLYAFRGMEVEMDQIIIGAGTEYLYNLMIQLLGRDQVYGVEDPGYKKLPQIYRQNGVRCVSLPMDGSGIRVDALENSGVDVIHLSPSHHFPTGIVTPVTRRYELLGWAARAKNRYIIEDDYDCEFRLFGRPIQTLQGIDKRESVIYMNTFTKSLAPSFRISYMVLPKHLAGAFREKLGFYSCTVSNLEQYVLALFIERGYFEKHINRMRNYYREKRDFLIRQIRQSPLAQKVRISEQDSGLHFLMTVQTDKTDAEIIREAEQAGIRINALSLYYQNPQEAVPHVFIMNYAGVSEEKFGEAIKRLADVML